MSYNKSLIYLSGSIESKKDLGNIWRREIIALAEPTFSGYSFYNPCDEDPPLLYEVYPDKKTFFNSKTTSDGQPSQDFKDIVTAMINHDIDKMYEETVAVILMYENVMSWGSAGEITLAQFLSIPVVTINATGSINDVPGWVIGCSNVIVNDMESALVEVKQRLEWAIDEDKFFQMSET